jgi:hypothetical protein
VLHGVIVRLMDFGRCCGVEMNVGKYNGDVNLKVTALRTDYDRHVTTGGCGTFQLCG